MRSCILALALSLVGSAVSAATIERAGIAVDIPDLWTRVDQPGGTLLTYPYRGKAGEAATAKILVAIPQPGRLAARWKNFVGASKVIAAETPLQHDEGQTWTGGAMRWEQRCCRIGQASAEAIHVGVEQGGTTQLFLLLLVDPDDATRLTLLGTYQAVVRSVRAVGAKAGMPAPPVGAGGLDGLHATLRTNLMPNAFGGMNFNVDLATITFDPSGVFVRDVLADGSVPARCALKSSDCGTYVIHGGTIELTEQEDDYGRVSHSTVPFARSADGTLKIDSETWNSKTPFPAGSTLAGTWRYQWASSGNMAFSSGSAVVQKSLTLRADGRFTRTGFSSFSSQHDMGSMTTSVVGSHPKPEEAGRYTLDGYKLVLTPEGKPAETKTIFEADPNDRMLVIGGDNYSKKTVSK